MYLSLAEWEQAFHEAQMAVGAGATDGIVIRLSKALLDVVEVTKYKPPVTKPPQEATDA